MERLVSMWYKDNSLPENYVFPPETRPGKSIVPSCNKIPLIDLSQAVDHHRSDTIQRILQAGNQFGFFQLTNHGIPEKLINDTMSIFKEFFEMPAEHKASVYSEDPSKSCKLYTSSVHYNREKIHFWRDNLRHPCHPLDECLQQWPERPTRYREIVGAYAIEAKKLGSVILELISEGLGLETGYFRDEISESSFLSVNYYPPCPDPSLTLGIPKHADANLITVLLQGDVSGLQVFRNGKWIGVEPLPNVFVVNIGYALQIISNNKLKSAEHRAVTNSKDARISAAFFICPANSAVIEPAKALTDHPLYRSTQYKDFLAQYISVAGDTKLALEPFKLQA